MKLQSRCRPRAIGICGEGVTEEAFVTSFTTKRPDKQQGEDHAFQNSLTF